MGIAKLGPGTCSTSVLSSPSAGIAGKRATLRKVASRRRVEQTGKHVSGPNKRSTRSWGEGDSFKIQYRANRAIRLNCAYLADRGWR